MEHVLAERGLRLSPEKTRSTHSEDGCDFRGQQVRRPGNGTVLLKPSRPSVRTFLTTLREVIRGAGRSLRAGDWMLVLTPQSRGWAWYHRHAASKRTFGYVDHQLQQARWRWARRRHRGHSAPWVKRRYWTPTGGRPWVFGGERLTRKGEPYPVKLRPAADVRLERPVLLRHEANP